MARDARLSGESDQTTRSMVESKDAAFLTAE
jgi:hypothetical protein